MISVLHNFSAPERARLWRVLGGLLEPGGRLVFNWRDRVAAVPGELEVMGSYQVGRHTYEVAGQVLEAGGESVTSRFVYRTRRGETVLSEDEVVSTGHWPSGERLAAELVEAGFVRGEAPEGMQRWDFRK
jgi:hypothetical protein